MRNACLFSLLVLTACGSDPEPVPVEPPAGDTVLCAAAGADYMNGVGTLSVVSLPSRTVFQNVLPGAASGDPVLRVLGGKLFVVNRFGANNVTVVDVSQPIWRVERQFSTGAGSNPQDAALAGTRLYVVTNDAPDLLVWDLAQPTDQPTKRISLAAHDTDGNPDAQSIHVVGNRAFITIGLLDRTGEFPVASGPGKVLVLDTTTDAVVATVTLQHANPYGFLVQDGDELLVPTLADFSGTDGCVEVIGTEATPAHHGCLVENQALGNYTVSSIAVTTSHEVFLATSQYDITLEEQIGQLRRLDGTGQLATGSLSPAAQIPTDVVWAPGVNLVVYSERTGGGLRVWDVAAGAEVTTSALDIGLPPATQNALACWTR